MEEEEGARKSENGRRSTELQSLEEDYYHEECEVVKFLDSVDNYLTLLESLSSTLRQGWLELASARHSMGTSRINSTLFDLKNHCAATTLQLTQYDVDSAMKHPNFTLGKWVSPDYQKRSSKEEKFSEDELSQKKSTNPYLRHRGASEIQEKIPENNGSSDSSLTVDNQIQKERSKPLSMFGTLVSPKLRASQVSFEEALDTLVQIANMRSSMLSAYDQVRKKMESTKG